MLKINYNQLKLKQVRVMCHPLHTHKDVSIQFDFESVSLK